MKILKFLAAAFLCANSLSAQEYVGGDISLLPKYEQNGAKYFDHDGRPVTDVIAFFKQQGLNSMRVRLFVNPENASTTDKGQGVCQDLEFVKYCCPVNFQTAQETFPKPFRIGLRGFFFKKQAP